MADDLTQSELVPIGGSWSGLLFANPMADVETALTWSFTFDFAEIERDYGDVTPGLTVDWAPLPGLASWRGLASANITCATFGEPVETSVYYFEHHRYDRVEFSVLDQDGGRLRARVLVSGDIDGLGIPELEVEAWLDFEGIIVQLPDQPGSLQASEIELARFTSVEGLEGRDQGRNHVFEPAGS
jgi:hypothetical protein